VLFDSATIAPPLLTTPNWQYFQLPAELERDTDTDEVVNFGDVGPGWHTWKAIIGETQVTYEIDLYRDGVRNISTTPGDGTPGVPDGTMTFNIGPQDSGFNNLRIGGPSGVASSGGGVVFDNISLKLVDIIAPPEINADFNGNEIVDAADFAVWRENLGTGTLQSQGDADGDGDVDNDDYGHWKATFGSMPGGGSVAGAGGVAVPEPTSLVLLLGGALAALGCARRR
jgi:hypothetical protein